MADYEARIDLTASTFPLLSEDFGRTVLGKPKFESNQEEDYPQVYYCHNVLPTKRGFDSVEYEEIVPAISPTITLVEKIIEIKGNQRNRYYLSWSITGEPYIIAPGSITWTKLSSTVPVTESSSFNKDNVTFGTVNGITYIYYKGIACFIYDETTSSLVEVTLTGLTLANIIGITASSGYLIAYSEFAIAWSSTINPIDFIPSEVTGAGGGNVADIRGAIKFAFANNLGLLIYSETNVVAGTYTGNVRFPFKFREVDNSKGGIEQDLVAYSANISTQFVFSRAGLQSVSSSKASIILPDITDFFIGDKFEDFNETTIIFTQTELTSPMTKKLQYIGGRYLILSYGVDSFTHAIVYDTALERMGKLKIAHAYCFEYASQNNETSKESIAFLRTDGSITLLKAAPNSGTGVLLLGKYQYVRSRFMQLHSFEIENIRDTDSLTVYDGYSFDGKNIVFELAYLNKIQGQYREFKFNRTALDHSLLLIGAFKLVSGIIHFTVGGDR